MASTAPVITLFSSPRAHQIQPPLPLSSPDLPALESILSKEGRPSALRLGSHAQPLPDGALGDLRSAGSLARGSVLGEDELDICAEGGKERIPAHADGIEGEVKPKKKRKRKDPTTLKLDRKPESTKCAKSQQGRLPADATLRRPKKQPSPSHDAGFGQSEDVEAGFSLKHFAYQATRSDALEKGSKQGHDRPEIFTSETLTKAGPKRKRQSVEEGKEDQTKIQGKVSKPGSLKRPSEAAFKSPMGYERNGPPFEGFVADSGRQSAQVSNNAADARIDLPLQHNQTATHGLELIKVDQIRGTEDTGEKTLRKSQHSQPQMSSKSELLSIPNGVPSDKLPSPKPTGKNSNTLLARSKKVNATIVSPPKKRGKKSAPEKPKVASKSSRTITAQSLSRLKQPEENTTPDERHAVPHVLLTGNRDAVKRPKQTRKQKIVTKRPKLLDPELAKTRMEIQDFMFGTSSQLTKEEDPVLLRELQNAIKESEDASVIQVGDEGYASGAAVDTASGIPGTKQLWSAWTRNDDESTFQPSQQVRISTIDSPAEISLTGALKNQAHDADTYGDIDNVVTPATVKRLRFASSTRSKGKPGLACQAYVTALSPSPPQRPVFETLPANVQMSPRRLAHLKASKTEKPRSKKRSAVAAKSSSKRATPPSNITTEAAGGHSPKRWRGRPKKAEGSPATSSKRINASKRPVRTEQDRHVDDNDFQAISEIEDSEPEPPSSPPRKLKNKATDPPANPAAAQTASGNPEHPTTFDRERLPSNYNEQEHIYQHARAFLFPKIDLAIKSAPRSQDLARPSWCEKILLYDPIVLEDLTEWLNSGALKDAGWYGFRHACDGDDGEWNAPDQCVAIDEAEASGARKKKRKTKNQEMIEQREKQRELERDCVQVRPKLVQKWCEERSVCCLWRVGLRGGVKANY